MFTYGHLLGAGNGASGLIGTRRAAPVPEPTAGGVLSVDSATVAKATGPTVPALMDPPVPAGLRPGRRESPGDGLGFSLHEFGVYRTEPTSTAVPERAPPAAGVPELRGPSPRVQPTELGLCPRRQL